MYFRAWGSLPLRQLPFRPALQSISPARCLSTSQMFRQLVLPPRGPLPVRLLSNSAHPFDKVVRLARIEEAKKKAEAEFQSYAPIPSPPRAILYPVTQEDIDMYLKPLYTRKWGVVLNNRALTPLKSLYLAKVFKFSNYEAVMVFINDVSSIVREQNHHPEITFNTNTVIVRTHTHHMSGPAVDAHQVTPGITAADVRLAILIEKRFATAYLPSARGRATGTRWPGWVPEKLDELKELADKASEGRM